MDKPVLPDAFAAGTVAVVTGAASGIGVAAATRFSAMGMRVALVDLPGAALDAAGDGLTRLGGEILVVPADVSSRAAVEHARDTVFARWGAVAVLINNAATGSNPGQPWENGEGWEALLGVNLSGVMHGVQAFVPAMIAGDRPAVVINTGSKQGITSPPGNAAYNLSKAGVRSFTESLAHALREAVGTRISAHLLIPGYTHTGMTGRADKPDAAWTAEQVVDFLLDGIAAGEFYILCPDNAVDRGTDEKRMRWAMDDIICGRPALSRWHPAHKDAFERFMAE